MNRRDSLDDSYADTNKGSSTDFAPGGRVDAQTQVGIPLIQLLRQVKESIMDRFTYPQWVQAEIVNIQGKNHIYLELSDRDAKARGMIWSDKRKIIDRFTEATGLPLKAGLRVLFKARPQFSEQYGLSLNIVDINPEFTLGDLERQIQQIRQELQEQGLYDRNRLHPVPQDFTRVAVIAPEQAAGLGDFQTIASKLARTELCFFDLYHAQFQGAGSTESLIHALSQVANKADDYDAVIMIRGGGDKAGLYALNSLQLAKAVSSFPLPVIVGIGHERDKTILDEVACIRMATPSLAASFVANTVIGRGQAVLKSLAFIEQYSRRLLEQQHHRIDQDVSRIHTMMSTHIKSINEKMDQQVVEFRRAAVWRVEHAREQLKGRVGDCLSRDPNAILARGYSVVMNDQLSVVRQVKDVTSTLTLRTQNETITLRGITHD